jgi:hypothetical protein
MSAAGLALTLAGLLLSERKLKTTVKERQV